MQLKRNLTRTTTDPTNKEIIEEVAAITGLTKHQIEQIYLSEFKFVRAVMEEGELNGVTIPNFGRYMVTPARAYKLGRHKTDKRELKLARKNRRTNKQIEEDNARQVTGDSGWVEEFSNQETRSGISSNGESQNMLPVQEQ